MKTTPVADFVIIPPAERGAEFSSASERLTAWMASEFPDVHFLLVPPNELSGDEAVVVPILGGVGEGDAVQMRPQPSAEFVQAIRRRAAARAAHRSIEAKSPPGEGGLNRGTNVLVAGFKSRARYAILGVAGKRRNFPELSRDSSILRDVGQGPGGLPPHLNDMANCRC